MSKTGKVEPAEPASVRAYFERDPAAGAQWAQINAIGRTTGRNALERFARSLQASVAAVHEIEGEGLLEAVNERMFFAASSASEMASRNFDDLAVKLATLVRWQAQHGTRDGADMAGRIAADLAASALADAVLLRAGPIAWPEGATVPATSPEDIARWRRIAAEAEAEAETD